jgi:hypothetical protein
MGTNVVHPRAKALNSSIDDSAFTLIQPKTVGSKVTELTSGNCIASSHTCSLSGLHGVDGIQSHHHSKPDKP